jgi:hypothetical protein
VRGTISEEGGCGCSLLSDDADWNATFWAMRPEVLDQLAQTPPILVDEGPRHLTIEDLWIGDTPRETVKLTSAEFIRLVQASPLGTRTRYELAAESER